MEIIKINSGDFKTYEDALVDLYIAAFSEGNSFQYYSREDAGHHLQSLLNVGYGILVIEGDSLLGVILLAPMSYDDLIPDSISQHFNVSQAIYVAEMMVKKSYQGRGIGKNLLYSFLETVDRKQYHNAFIRVWVKNTAAIGLYEKMGFKTCASIEQQKLLADKSERFNFKKNYLHQELR